MLLAAAVAWLAGLGFAPALRANAAQVAGVGFEKSALRVVHRDGAKRSSTLFLWYPSATPSRRYDYGEQIGFATRSAPLASGTHPLLLFSHGYLGAGSQSIFLTEALARAGYVVAAIDHADAVSSPQRPLVPNFLDPASWDEHEQRDRAEDLRFLLDHLLARARRAGDALRAENHFGWTDLACLGRTTIECGQRENPQQMLAFTTAFFDRHLRGRAAPKLDSGDRALASYRSQTR